MRKTSKLIVFFVLLFALIFFLSSKTLAAECDAEKTAYDNSSGQDRITKNQDYQVCLSAQVSKLSSQAKTLSNQIAQFDAQIRLTLLKITQTEEKIVLLGGRIDQLEVSITDLSRAFSSRVVETYKMTRSGLPFFLLISSTDINEAVTRYNYLQRIQEADQSLLERFQKAQNEYKGEKTNQEQLQKELQKQKANLNSQKAAKANLLAVTRNDEKRYQQLLSEAQAQLAAFRRFVASQGGASILSNQTRCNGWGCYFNQRDSLWGNIGMGGSSYSTAGYGCLVSSVAMVASHYGKNIKPGDISVLPSAFFAGTGLLLHSFSVNGVSVSISKVSAGLLDSELAAGRPVIAGLYGGPDHFIVILRKEGDKYIMHDPFLENGAERPLTDKYNVSDITSLRLVSFN